MPSYGRCTDGDDEHTRHIKTIARTRGGRVLSALTPHSFEYAEGAYAVNERREPIDDYLTEECALAAGCESATLGFKGKPSWHAGYLCPPESL